MFLAKNAELLAAFKAGDTQALETVYTHYAPGVHAFLRKGFTFRGAKGTFYFKGMQELSDLEPAVQEVFRRAFEPRARQSYNGVNSFTNWVLAISRNMVINRFRNREISFSSYISPSDGRSHLTVLDDIVSPDYGGMLYARQSKSQDTAFEHGELKGLMAQFFKELTPRDQEILTLRFAEGLGQEDSARALGSTRMKIRTAEAKLRSRLRAFLRNSGYLDNLGDESENS